MEEKSIAYEMLEELKRANERLERTSNSNSKRCFVIAIVELVIIISMVIGFLIYQSQYDYVATDELYQDISDSELENSTLNQNIGE